MYMGDRKMVIERIDVIENVHHKCLLKLLLAVVVINCKVQVSNVFGFELNDANLSAWEPPCQQASFQTFHGAAQVSSTPIMRHTLMSLRKLMQLLIKMAPQSLQRSKAM